MSACATKDPEAIAQHDPWEPTNRAVFDFDIQVDHAVARPVAKFYRSAVPEPAREGVHNALTNLNSPVVFTNDVLQGESEKATDTFGRFMINSTVGVAGLVDIAAKMGIPGHDNDFGITLGKAGAVGRLVSGAALCRPQAAARPDRHRRRYRLRPAHLHELEQFHPLHDHSWRSGRARQPRRQHR